MENCPSRAKETVCANGTNPTGVEGAGEREVGGRFRRKRIYAQL